MKLIQKLICFNIIISFITTILFISESNALEATISALKRIDAENFTTQSGSVITETCSYGSQDISHIESGDYTEYDNVDFGTGVVSFIANVASNGCSGNIELRLDSLNGTLIGICSVFSTGDWQIWTNRTCTVSEVAGIHNLYLKYTGKSGNLFNINWFKFSTAPQSQSNLVRLRNSWYNSEYLYEDNGQVKYGTPAVTDQSSQWVLEDFNGNERIKNVATGHYISTKHSYDYVECVDINNLDTSAQWNVLDGDTSVYKLIQNVANSGTYVNVEGQKGYAQCYNISTSAGTPKWLVESVVIQETPPLASAEIANSFPSLDLYELNNIFYNTFPEGINETGKLFTLNDFLVNGTQSYYLKITFVNNGGAFSNRMGYFILDSSGNITDEVELFKNMLTMSTGMSLYIGPFTAQQKLGFYLQSPEGEFYSLKSLNPDGVSHIGLYKDIDNSNKFVAIGFEDTITGSSLNDSDFNDEFFAVQLVQNQDEYGFPGVPPRVSSNPWNNDNSVTITENTSTGWVSLDCGGDGSISYEIDSSNSTLPGTFLNDGEKRFSFTPQTGWSGIAKFSFRVKDEWGNYSGWKTEFINVLSINHAPAIANSSKDGIQDSTINFILQDFSPAFSDADGDTLQKIKITRLPSNGALLLNNTNITLNQEITAADIPQIAFVPNTRWYGSTSFSWYGFDGTDYSANPGDFSLNIAQLINPPVVSGRVQYTIQYSSLTVVFKSDYFIKNYYSPEGRILQKIKFTSLSPHGRLTYNGRPVNINDEINVADINKIKFYAEPGWYGNTDLKWKAFDGISYSIQDGIITLKLVDPACNVG